MGLSFYFFLNYSSISIMTETNSSLEKVFKQLNDIQIKFSLNYQYFNGKYRDKWIKFITEIVKINSEYLPKLDDPAWIFYYNKLCSMNITGTEYGLLVNPLLTNLEKTANLLVNMEKLCNNIIELFAKYEPLREVSEKNNYFTKRRDKLESRVKTFGIFQIDNCYYNYGSDKYRNNNFDTQTDLLIDETKIQAEILVKHKLDNYMLAIISVCSIAMIFIALAGLELILPNSIVYLSCEIISMCIYCIIFTALIYNQKYKNESILVDNYHYQIVRNGSYYLIKPKKDGWIELFGVYHSKLYTKELKSQIDILASDIRKIKTNSQNIFGAGKISINYADTTSIRVPDTRLPVVSDDYYTRSLSDLQLIKEV